jgi:hypothetical protein
MTGAIVPLIGLDTESCGCRVSAARASPPIVVEVVRTLDQLPQIYALRGIVYMGEQDCPFDEEFDGNDLSGATHLVARVGREPVGAIRIRWFAGFAKLGARGGGAAPIARAGSRTRCGKRVRRSPRRRAIGTFLVISSPRLLGFWERCAGFRLREGRAAFRFSDREYVEVIAELPARADAITLDAPALVLLQAGGRVGCAGCAG